MNADNISFDDRYDADAYTYEEEELEPPPPEDRDGLEDDAQLNDAGDPLMEHRHTVNGVNVQQQGVVTSGDTRAANTPGSKAIPPDQRTTTPYMTKYEKARLLGTRALQIR